MSNSLDKRTWIMEGEIAIKWVQFVTDGIRERLGQQDVDYYIMCAPVNRREQ